MTEQELVDAAERGEAVGALPGWVYNKIIKCWDHEAREATLLREEGGWVLYTSDGLYSWSVKTARQGMHEELLP